MVNAAELLARIRQRKQELKSWEWWDINPSNSIHHPAAIQVNANNTSSENVPLTLHLTKQELKRQRKIDRETSREDKRQRIRLGIDTPPPPKLKLSNVASVYGATYVQDPTRYELEAQKSEESRRNEHLLENERRKLTKEQRWEKQRSKVESHRESGIHCAAFYLNSPLDPKQQFIVDYTSKKFLCTGVCMLGDKDAFIIVECGEPEVSKVTKLLSSKFHARLVWKGELRTANFRRWSMHKTPKREEFLKVYGVESIYEQALSTLKAS